MLKIKGIPFLHEGKKLYFRGQPNTTYTSFPTSGISPIKGGQFFIKLDSKTKCYKNSRDIPLCDIEGEKMIILCKIKKYKFKSKLRHNEGEWVNGWYIVAVKINITPNW